VLQACTMTCKGGGKRFKTGSIFVKSILAQADQVPTWRSLSGISQKSFRRHPPSSYQDG
jgi:hypothetical protein